MDLSLALATFLEESRELLAQMEDILLRADRGEAGGEDMNALFRCAHTIKGSAGLFGLDAVVHFTHGVENVLDRLRNGDLAFSGELVTLLLEAQDHIAHQVAAIAAGDPVEEAAGAPLLARLRVFAGEADGGVPAEAPRADEPACTVEAGSSVPIGAEHWHLSLRFGPEVLRNGMDPLSFIHYLRTLGELVHVETVTDALPDLEGGDPEVCWLGFEVALRSPASKAEIESVFEFVQDSATIIIVPPNSRVEDFIALIESLDEDQRRLGEILVACGSLTPRELEEALACQQAAVPPQRLGQVLVEQAVVQPQVVEAALGKQRAAEERRSSEAKSVKVPADRLDALIDQVGELVIAGAATQLQAQLIHSRELHETASNLLRLVEDVRDAALRLRMTPIGEVFNRFPRVVRDVSRELGKDIELRIGGAETELDKSMVEKIGDPLMHLVRNAIDHGIESPERRLAAGKPARGTLQLDAYHESGSIVIEVADDGGGLDSERIFAKAVERGLVAPEAHLTTAEIHRLILEPGFSTASQVTNLSGRGVGMDVVKSNVEALRGSLDIDSTPGRGTTMRLCLPLTLAIIDGFRVGVGEASFILPLDAVLECIELPDGVGEAAYLNLRDQVLPFVRLRRMFAIAGESPARQSVVVVRFAGRQAGIVVDRLLGECQTVIKPLGRLFEKVAGIAGSTILGTGDVALILDVPQLVQRAIAHEGRLTGSGQRARALAA
ncbi:chemotaxis protein CheA [Thauera aromatica]|uniref:chemotaxis protein CheA n=1 Tax=Thauera aromatica TaxID=59405 RepID=UPI001FFD90F0|nr:chemotaxis protein CheA [Thauera aromatica]MCK2095764.1 chemotaxis protein CheA [Thauera aromatica]